MCLIPFCMNDLISLLTKLDTLSDTKISGKQYEWHLCLVLSFTMVVLDVAKSTQWMSIYLEPASMIRRNIFAIKGPRDGCGLWSIWEG